MASISVKKKKKDQAVPIYLLKKAKILTSPPIYYMIEVPQAQLQGLSIIDILLFLFFHQLAIAGTLGFVES